jgi:hypothetical protein
MEPSTAAQIRLHPVIRHVSLGDFHDIPSFPVVLHVCSESRQQAIRSGYALGFSTRWTLAQTWFNFKTDYLHTCSLDNMAYPAEYHVQDRQRVTRLALERRFSDIPEDVFYFLKLFKNLEELIIVVAEDFPSCRVDWWFVDCTVAEALGPGNPWRPWSIDAH